MKLHAIVDELKGQRGIQFGAAEADAAIELLNRMPTIIS